MRHLKSFTALMLTVCMISSSIPVEAAVNRPQAEGKTTSEEGIDEDSAYADGEAMILYEEKSSSVRSLEAANALGADMQIEETYEFDAAQDLSSKKSRSSKSNTSQTLKVSLVTSDTYSTEELVKQLKARKDIIAAEPNYKIHALDTKQDAYVKYQWAIENLGQNNGTVGLDVNPESGNTGGGADGEECVIALVDTGIDYTHEDLKNVVWNNPIQTGKLRGSHGYDFSNQDADPMDDNGHGTHCSGIMAAEYNNVGIRGIVNNSKIKIMALKILDEEGAGYAMESVGAYNYIYKAQQLGIHIVAINNSWGGLDEEESVILPKLIELVGKKGALSICAAGNESMDNDVGEALPANIDSPYVISVAAANENDELAAFSNYGRGSVDLAAPGTDILSTVSYPCFNPGIYENPDELCSIFEDFTDGNLVQGSAANEDDIAYGFAETEGKAKLSLDLTEEAWFGLKGDRERSLKWSIQGAKAGETYILYFPYTAGASKTDMYDSIMVKAVETVSADDGMENDDYEEASMVFVSDCELTKEEASNMTGMDVLSGMVDVFGVDKGNYWNHATGAVAKAHSVDQERVLAISLGVLKDADYEIYLDNMGISRPDVKAEQFGKYDYYNGTSMATPYVTGAAAVIACAYPQEDMRDLREHILRCTRKNEALNGKVASGGTMDLSKIGEPNFYLKDILLDGNKDIRIEGRCLSEASVTMNGKAVTPKEQNENEIILDSDGYLNRSLDIAVALGGETISRKCFFSKGEGFDSAGIINRTFWDGDVVSDGEKIYLIDEVGTVINISPDKEDEDMGGILWMEDYYIYLPSMFGVDGDLIGNNYEISRLSDVVCLDHKLWTVLKLDLQFSEETILAYYDSMEGWKAAAELPGEFENAEGISIAAYQGELYLLGGLDHDSGKTQTAVMYMDPLSHEWKTGVSLPEGRAFAKAVATGNELVLTLGKNDADTLPGNLIFDGKSWKVSQADPGIAAANRSYFYFDNEMKEKTASYYSACVGAVEGGIAYAGLQIENLGDTFFYQLSSDQYTAADYSLTNTDIKDAAAGYAVVMRDKMYLLEPEEENTNVFAMPVPDASIEVVSNVEVDIDMEEGILEGIRHYMPGDIISVTAEAWEGYFVRKFTVDGTKVTKDAEGRYQYRAVADPAKKKVKVSLEFGYYVLELFMDEDIVELYPGQTYRPTVHVYPANADNPNIQWTSDKPGIVSVNKKNGKLTVSPKAKRGSTVTITAVASDRKTVRASFIVEVISKPLPWKNEIVNSGKLKYKVTASSAKKKTVTCSGFSDKAQQSVKIPETIRINGYTYKVTGIAKNAFAKNRKIKSVTIGKNITSIGQNAFSGCSSLKTIKITGANLKTIGKNAWKGIHRKAVISVPKKQKKSYKTKLKKSGYSGKVK